MTKTIKISDSIHHQLRLLAVHKRVKLQALIDSLLLAALHRDKPSAPSAARYLRGIDQRARCLTQSDVFNGTNPKSYVRSQASFIKTDVRRLARALDLDIEWSRRRD